MNQFNLSKAFSSKTNSLSFTLKWASWASSLNFATQKEGPGTYHKHKETSNVMSFLCPSHITGSHL